MAIWYVSLVSVDGFTRHPITSSKQIISRHQSTPLHNINLLQHHLSLLHHHFPKAINKITTVSGTVTAKYIQNRDWPTAKSPPILKSVAIKETGTNINPSTVNLDKLFESDIDFSVSMRCIWAVMT